ncbi:hypothetical protein HMPREF9136_2002 [Prevotella dentalis DSM 3688]|uniref:Uncharacterized protein n=1 Tax=Prevotella dentalis (strain ATCC 49559 / DSM 3688 / JCM 13448 / NCTC 12043 / ES 2772) TaxID=908937 RepID=F9D574_PREDD|nr:hypothetical protein HMPREF9136_2002 [Prevotella dentalis DSM 3688]
MKFINKQVYIFTCETSVFYFIFLLIIVGFFTHKSTISLPVRKKTTN